MAVMSWVTWAGNCPSRSMTVFCCESRIPRSTPPSSSVLTTSTFPQRAASCSAVPPGVRTLTSKPAASNTATTALETYRVTDRSLRVQISARKQIVAQETAICRTPGYTILQETEETWQILNKWTLYDDKFLFHERYAALTGKCHKWIRKWIRAASFHCNLLFTHLIRATDGVVK